MRQRQALSVMMGGANIFLTGAPGAGKTYMLNQFVKAAKAAGKRVAVTASTGIAATHIGGTTIHSWAGIGIRDHLDKRDKARLADSPKFIKRYNGTDILVIDEISMLHGLRLDMVNELAQLLRKNDQPFGGLQVILVGDLFQLPPVNPGSDLADFAHNSVAWAQLDPSICYLTEQHRQAADDSLLKLLEAMRSDQLDVYHHELIKSRIGLQPPKRAPVTRLYSHNIDVDAINQKHLQLLPGEQKAYTMQTNGQARRVEQLAKSVLAPEMLELKIGAEVMFVANSFVSGFFNGSRGQVVEFSNGFPVVKLASRNRLIKVEPHSWTLQEDGRQLAEVVQLPLRLAWAITIHKSQGMSLDAAEIDLSQTFTPGMGYVALSRVRSLDGIYLRGINAMALNLHPDIFDFDAQLRRASTALATNTVDWIAAAAQDVAVEAPIDKNLMSALKDWRLARARADGVSAFIVAHNTLLEAIAKHRPSTSQQLLGLSGFGANKLEKYGQDILQIVARHITEPAKSPAAA